MSRRIDIELTSALGDGSWTWRAAGARQPKGVLDGSILSPDAKVGDELKVEIEQEIDGITVLSVVHGRQKHDADNVIELLPTERDFQPVVETRAKRERGERRGRDGGRRPRGDRRDGGRRGEGRDGRGGGRDGRDRDGRDRDGRGRDGGRGRRGPGFTPPPEVPQRPKPKRLRPGKQHRNEVLAELPEEQRPIAELTLQGMGAVRQRLREENEKAVAEGRAVMPEASVMKMAEELLPKMRVAEWRDRAEAAQRQVEHLDLRDLRSVVAAAGDPIVARDDSTSALVGELQAALVKKQDAELQLWFGDVDAALAVGRVIRALRLSSQPPKAGVPFPADIAQRLVDSANASLAPMDSPERWAAMLEAAAFSPIRSQVQPTRKPDVVNDELLATVTRLGPALPQVAALFEIEVDPSAPMPKPLRPGPRGGRKGGDGDRNRKKGRGDGRDGDRGKSDTSGRSERPPRKERQPKQRKSKQGETSTAAADEAGEQLDEAAAVTISDDVPATEPTPATNDTSSDDAPATNDTPPEVPATEPAPATNDTRANEPAPATNDTPPDDTPANEPAPATNDTPPDDTPANEPAPATNDTPPDDTPANEPAPATNDTPPEVPANEPAPATNDTPPEVPANEPAPATNDTPSDDTPATEPDVAVGDEPPTA